MRQFLNWDKYNIDSGDFIYDEIYVDWYSLSIYDIYFDNNYVDNNNINNDNNNNDDVIYDVLITLEANEREIIIDYYFYANFNMKRLKLKSKIIMHLKQRKKMSWKVLTEHPRN
jgi:hypothetical protein